MWHVYIISLFHEKCNFKSITNKNCPCYYKNDASKTFFYVYIKKCLLAKDFT